MKHRIEIEIGDEAIALAREEFRSTFPAASPDEWTETDLRRAIDVLDSQAAADFAIVGYTAIGGERSHD